jgi:transposase
MARTRKSHPPSLRAKVAIEAIEAHKTTAQITQMFGVHPTQVGGWKKHALAGTSLTSSATAASRCASRATRGN